MNSFRPLLSSLPSAVRIPGIPKSSLKFLETHGLLALVPTKNPRTGKWRPPLLPPKLSSRIRNYAIRNNDVGPGKLWNPVWDLKTPKLSRVASPKGHKRDRTREKRAQRIEEKMEQMDSRIAEYRARVDERRPLPGIESLFKRMSGNRK